MLPKLWWTIMIHCSTGNFDTHYEVAYRLSVGIKISDLVFSAVADLFTWPAQFGQKLVLGTRYKWPRPISQPPNTETKMLTKTTTLLIATSECGVIMFSVHVSVCDAPSFESINLVKIKVRQDGASSPVLLPPTYADPVRGWSGILNTGQKLCSINETLF